MAMAQRAGRIMPLGLMFHHFVDDKHPYIQGALSADEFEQVILSVGPQRILQPDAWMEGLKTGTLKDSDLCFTFDDALLSQAEVALPVLDKYGIKSFFFVYSSIFEGQVDLFEIIRVFRNLSFSSNEEFYESFYATIRKTQFWPRIERAMRSPEAAAHLSNYGFYTKADRVFRYVRDRVIDRPTFYATAETMMRARGFDKAEASRRLWLDDAWIKRIDAAGHTIGLHSTSHPTDLGKWSRQEQFREYEANRQHLVKVLGKPPRSVAYPSGCYNSDTLDIMREMRVEIGFRSDEGDRSGRPLEQSRLDYSLYMQRIGRSAA